MPNPVEGAMAFPTIGVLMRAKCLMARHRVTQIVRESPLKIAATLVLLLIIWLGLFFLFVAVLKQLEQSLLESVVATQLIFNLFFGTLLVLLTLSNAVLVYGSLFNRPESDYLLASPMNPGSWITIKYLESLLFSSWALILLGLPLMAAMAYEKQERWYFMPVFLALFISFIPIPAGLGLLVAGASAQWLRPRIRQWTLGLLGAAAIALVVLILRDARLSDGRVDLWLGSFLRRMGFLQSPVLPSSWVARSLDHLWHGNRPGDIVGYLLTTVSNGLFISWLAITWLSGSIVKANTKASSGSRRSDYRAADPAAAAIFFYLPRETRLIAMKDLRTFMRDPMQWSQLAILFGLMVLYLINVPPLHLDFRSANWGWVVPHLNLCAVAFLLATFTSRFVFPLVSMEGHQFWLLGLLPITRTGILVAKFAFAITVTFPVGVGATVLASLVLQVPYSWLGVHVGVASALCIGLCGIAAGLGAVMPSFEEINPARIANGLGGTTSLVVSVLLVVGTMAALTLVGVRAQRLHLNEVLDGISLLWSALIILCASLVGVVSMWLGARQLKRVEL